MRRLTNLLLPLLGMPLLSWSQQRRGFDAYTFEAPAGYQVREASGLQEWSRVDQQRRFYCQIALYRAQNSLGSAKADAEAEWKAAVAPDFKPKGEPKDVELPLPQAPQSMMRGAPTTDRNGNAALSTLFVVRFPNRYVGIAFHVPNQQALEACQKEAIGLVMSVQLNPAAAAPAATPAPVAAPAGGAAPATQAPVVANVPGTVTGTWERVVATQPPTRYNPITRQWEHDYVGALNQFRHVMRLTFQPDGGYTRQLDAESFNRNTISRVVETGRYTAVGGAIRMEPQTYREGTAPRKQEPVLANGKLPAPYVLRYSMGEHPQYRDSAGLQIQESDGSWVTYKPPRPQ